MAETNFQEGVTITIAEMIESSKGQREHLKHRPMTLARYSSSHLVLPFSSLVWARVWLPETDRKSSTEVMSSTASVSTRTCFSHWSLKTSMLSWATLLCGRAANVRAALMTYLLEITHGHTDYTHQKRNKQVRDHVETLDLAASADKGILGVWEDNQNMKDGVGYQILVFCLLFVF